MATKFFNSRNPLGMGEGNLYGYVCIYMHIDAHSLSQESALHEGVDVVCGTPGRLNDHFQRGNLVSELEIIIVVCNICFCSSKAIRKYGRIQMLSVHHK